MESPEEILEKVVLSEPTICSRCLNKAMDSQQRSGTAGASPPCSEACGKLGISMEEEVISDTEIESRGEKLLNILKNNDVDIDEDAFKKAVNYYSNSYPPQEILEKAIGFGIGEHDVSELDEREDKKQLETSNSDSGAASGADERESKEPIELLAEGPVTETFLDKIEDISVRSELSVFDTPDGIDDVYYLDKPDRFEAEYDVDKAGEHTKSDVADLAVGLTWREKIQTSTIRKWVDRMDDRYKQLILSSAVRNRAPRTLPIDIHPEDSFRSSKYWPVVKSVISQPIISCIKRHQDDYVSTSEIAEETGFDEDVVQRVLYVLYENETVEPDKERGWRYVEEDRFREDKVPDDR